MKRYLSAVLAATLIAGLSSCGGGVQQTSSTAAPTETATATATQAPTESATATPSPTHASRPVPNVTGKTFAEAYTILMDADFYGWAYGKDGERWTNTTPDETIIVVSTTPAAGTVTSSEDIRINVGLTEAEGSAAAKGEVDASKVGPPKFVPHYGFDCTNSYSFEVGTPGVYQTLKEVWASPEYKDYETCSVEIDGEVASDVKSLLPSETAVAKVIAAHGGGTAGSPAGDFGTALELCAKPPFDYANQVSGRPEADRADAYGALALCPNAPHAALLRQAATTIKVDDGTKIVGKDMQPGTYRTEPGAKDCYWARTNGGGDIIANNFIGFAHAGVTVTVYAGEGFESQRCGVWTKIG